MRFRKSALTQANKRYAEAAVEIQVASVLMHAWAEVEHDLVYKRLEGELSDDESGRLQSRVLLAGLSVCAGRWDGCGVG